MPEQTDLSSITIEKIKKSNVPQLTALASEIRRFIISTLSVTGGHLASNLGVVDVTLALYKVFDFDKNDKIIWDVGHQSYTHKILTGRADRFSTLRKYGGLSGFPKYEEDRRDVFNTGHSSTSISAAVGIAKANELSGINAKTIAFIGDGAMNGGMAYEALNHSGHNAKDLIVIYNDNEMSISKSVGGFSRALKRLRNADKYLKLKDDVKSALDNIPVVGEPTKRKITRFKAELKNMIVDGSEIFESMGYYYMGPVDGHNIEELIRVLEYAKQQKEPVFLHICTKKGKGYRPAEENPGLYHGVGSFDQRSGRLYIAGKSRTWSEQFGDALCRIAENNKKVAAVTAAMPQGTGLTEFSKKFPNRFFDVGIAEQHAVTFSAGLARGGLVPVFAVYSTFLQRAYDQILHDTALQDLHVVFAVDRSGPVGGDGETHQGVFDISYLSHMPGMTLLSPAVDTDMEPMMDYLINKNNSPSAIRYPRGQVLTASDFPDTAIPELDGDNILKPRIIINKEKPDVVIFSVGVMLKNAYDAAKQLEADGISAALIDAVAIKPFSLRECGGIKSMLESARLVASVENNVVTGGFGQILQEELLRNKITQNVLKFAYPDEPVCQGRIPELENKYGLSADAISAKITEVMRKNG